MTHSNWARPPKTSPITPALTHTHTDRQTGTPSEAWLIYDLCRWFEHCVSARIIPCCPDFITSLFHSLTLVSLGFVLCATPVSFAKATQAFQQCRFGIFKSLTVLCMWLYCTKWSPGAGQPTRQDSSDKCFFCSHWMQKWRPVRSADKLSIVIKHKYCFLTYP